MKISVIRFVMIAAFFSLAVFAFGEQKTHTVQKGETLYSISRQYGLTVNELRQLNGLSDTSVLKVGQVLKVSAPETTTASSAATSASASGASSSAGNSASASSTAPSSSSAATTYEKYTVKAGDTFYSIARASGITVAELKKINDFGDDAVLKYGTVIKVPSKTTAETSTATASTPAATTPATAPTSGEVLLSVTDDPRKYDSNKKGNTNLEWPVKAKEVTYVSGKISGVTITATKNEAVVAIKEGNVTFSGFYRGFGNVVFIKSSAGYIYVYSGLGSVSVTLGTAVKHGDKIGTVGTDSLSGKTQINLMVYKNGMVIDPAVAPRG